VNVVIPGKDLIATVLRRRKSIWPNGYIACIFQFLTTILELLQVGYSVFVFACHFLRFFFYVILNVMEREKGGDIRAPAFLLF
jgi:hypothetical protein